MWCIYEAWSLNQASSRLCRLVSCCMSVTQFEVFQTLVALKQDQYCSRASLKCLSSQLGFLKWMRLFIYLTNFKDLLPQGFFLKHFNQSGRSVGPPLWSKLKYLSSNYVACLEIMVNPSPQRIQPQLEPQGFHLWFRVKSADNYCSDCYDIS